MNAIAVAMNMGLAELPAQTSLHDKWGEIRLSLGRHPFRNNFSGQALVLGHQYLHTNRPYSSRALATEMVKPRCSLASPGPSRCAPARPLSAPTMQEGEPDSSLFVATKTTKFAGPTDANPCGKMTCNRPNSVAKNRLGGTTRHRQAQAG